MDEQSTFWEALSQLFWLYLHTRALILNIESYAICLSSLEVVSVSFKFGKKLEEWLEALK